MGRTQGYLVRNDKSGQVGVLFTPNFAQGLTDEKWQEIQGACASLDPTPICFWNRKSVALVSQFAPKGVGTEREARTLKGKLGGIGIVVTPIHLPEAADVRRALDPNGG